MMGSNLMKNRKKRDKYDKTSVKLDGFVMKRNSRVCICSVCARMQCVHRKYLHIMAGDFVDLKKKYRYKIMGRYRMALYIRKTMNKIKEKNKLDY